MEDTVILTENKLASLFAAAALGVAGAAGHAKANDNYIPPVPSDNITHAEKHLPEHNWKSRGLKNNNPGNIKVGGEKWDGVVGHDGAFLKFKNMEYGLRAMAKLLTTYQSKYGLNTVEGIITKFAPKKDHNPTEKYIHEVSEYMGVARNQKIDLNNNNTMLDLLNAMVRMETGRDLPDTLVKKGIELARGTDKRDTEIAITRKDAKKEKV